MTLASLKGWLKRAARRALSVSRSIRTLRAGLGPPEAGEMLVAQLERAELQLDDYARHARWSRRLTSTPHEPEFRVFAHLDGADESLVDVGANVGATILSFRLFLPAAPIVSFEPNVLLESALAELAAHDDALTYHMVGLGREAGQMPLFIPCLDRRPLTPLASMNAERFVGTAQVRAIRSLADAGERQRLGVCRLDVQVRTLDEFELDPTIIKIDAETWEREVLIGAQATIQRRRPLLLVEGGTRDRDVLALLRSWSYMPCALDGDRLSLAETVDSDNGFFVAAERTDAYRACGLLR